MAHLLIQNENSILTIKHRAVCNEDNFHYIGQWREDINVAKKDVRRHRRNNAFHEVWIETKQTSIIRSLFVED